MHGSPHTLRPSGPAIGVLHNMSVPPRTTVEIQIKPVFGAVLISLGHCLRLNGFIDRECFIDETDFERLYDDALALTRRRSLEPFWARLGEKGFSPESAEARARSFGGACIGWSERIYPQRGSRTCYPPHDRICTDLNLCLAVLSRRAGNLFLSYRPPDYSLEPLFAWAFAADDPRLVDHSISWEDWPFTDFRRPSVYYRPARKDCPLTSSYRQPAKTGLNSTRP